MTVRYPVSTWEKIEAQFRNWPNTFGEKSRAEMQTQSWGEGLVSEPS